MFWSKDDSDHLCNSVEEKFRHTAYKEGTNYCGLTLNWNYQLGYIDTSMPNYIPKALKRLKCKPNKIRNALLINIFQ